MRRSALALVALLAAWPAQAQVEGSLVLGGKVVPLPPGPWRVLMQGAVQGRSADGGLPTTTHRALLVQERDGKAAAVVLAQAATEVGAVWNPHGICVNVSAGVLARVVERALRGSLDCRGLVLIGSGRGAGTPEVLNALYDEGERRPGWIPPRWISVQLVQSERMHWLSVEYRFAPGIFAPATAQATNWAEGVRSPAQQEVVHRLLGFAGQAQAELRRGLHGRAPSAPLPAPF